MYFNAVYSALMHAREEIYIMGWWICPQLYLRRPGKLVRPTTASVSLSAFTAQRRRAVGVIGLFPTAPDLPIAFSRLRMRCVFGAEGEVRGAGFAIRLPCDPS